MDSLARGVEFSALIRDFFEREAAPLRARISELEKRPDAEEVTRRIAHAVREAVAELPKPQDGQPGRAGVDGAPGERGQPGEPGRDGADAAPVADETIVAAVARFLVVNPPAAGRDGVDGAQGEKGDAGRDAEPLTPLAIIPVVARAVDEWLTSNPPAAGRDGADGAPGASGEKGEAGQAAEPVSQTAIVEAAADYLKTNPPIAGRDGADGKDGRDGLSGQDGKDGAAGVPGERGAPGADGVGLAGALIDRGGDLVITLTNGEARTLGPVVGRDGIDGKDGARGEAGFALEDFDSEVRDGGRTLVLRFQRGDILEVQEHALDVSIYRGVFRADHGYVRGDMVTFGGSLWHCNAPTGDPPKEGEATWTLAGKRGQNGKDGAPGKDGERGPQGLPGRDGR